MCDHMALPLCVSLESLPLAGGDMLQSENPVPATSTAAQPKALRRNIRGETPLHIAAIKV